MFRKVLSAALVSAAMVVAGPALAGPGGGGGGGGGHGGGVGAGANVGGHGGMSGGMSGGSMRGGMSGSLGGIDTNGQATRINSHASPNSSFNRGTTTTTTTTTRGHLSVQSSTLPGLTAGATVQTSTGTTLGTVSRIMTDRNGNIVGVLVTTSSGRTLRLSPTSLSMNGSILVTTNTGTNPAIGVSQGPLHASATGIAHANARSVLAGGAVAPTALPGLVTGLTVTNANATNIGTISQIVTDRAGNIRLVLVTNATTGQTFRLIPSTLTFRGTTVTTTSTVGG
jgi:sporulation protein YlmC with PRC-barrel domain